ncbi:glucose-6-phosphate isomerase, cytosolic 1 [Pelagophyceae sp. CCMP2097]|nr:glucose-6-phosphate isomerase, cytosolic 1 [Pelagophyceae sp. CCMP2097]
MELGFECGNFDDTDDSAAVECVESGEVRCPPLKSTAEWRALEQHTKQLEQTHLRTLLDDSQRCASLNLEVNLKSAAGAQVGPVVLDWARQKVTPETMGLLFQLARKMGVERKIERMRRGERVNLSERRAVLHMAVRAPRARHQATAVPLRDAIAASSNVRERIWDFADAVRSGRVCNLDGEPFKHIVVVGIGGSYLGPQFVAEAISTCIDPEPRLELRFIANVDPVGMEKATRGLDARRTLVVVVSKSWTTRETLRNAGLTKRWVLDAWRGSQHAGDAVVRSQFVACASRSAIDAVEKWGVDADRLFEFWNWVGGRYSSSASAGVLPLALACGSAAARDFLAGAHAVDEHFFETPLEQNIPAVMAMLGVWNVNFLGLGARAVVPYADGLSRFAAHVQQLEMESNGKSVTIDGRPLDYTTGEIVFGEPGTNAQHSFFQLLHMGQCVPCDFIGFMKPHKKENQEGHDELMANFFAQPDALAVGRTFEDVLNDVRVGDSDDLRLCPHRTLSGDRPSLSLLLPELSASTVGALLALYEHRCAVQGFVWDLNSWDQWGVELGKSLADEVRAIIERQPNAPPPNNPSTRRLLERYRAANSAAPGDVSAPDSSR